MQIMVSGIPVEVVKKNIKNMYLKVLPPDGRVCVSAPRRISNGRIEAFVGAKMDWIQKQQKRFEAETCWRELQYVSGEILYVWGRPYVLQAEYGQKRNGLVLLEDRVLLAVPKESTPARRAAFVKEWYRSLLKEQVEKYLPLWEARTGLYASGWQSKDMKTRWGSCNISTRKIWLNVQLAQKPVECLEYVILHELAHLEVSNHGPEFRAILDRHMPDWRSRRMRLNNREQKV